MSKKKLLWRFRKVSEADPFDVISCGCIIYVRDGTVVRFCVNHNIGRGECFT